MGTQVEITQADGVLRVRLNRPEKKNAITGTMYDAMRGALDDAAARDDVRVVSISAAGDVFSAGNDLKDFPALIGHRRAVALLLLGDAFGAEAAREAGIVTAIVPEPQAFAAAQAKRLAAKPKAALRATRALMRAGRDAIHAQMRREEAAFSEALRSAEARAAFAAFFERRPPGFSRAG